AFMINLWRDNFLPRSLLSKKMIIACIIGTIFLILSWYIFAHWRIAVGMDESEVGWVTDVIHQGRSYLERIIRSLRFHPEPWIVTALALPGLFSRHARILTVCGVVYSFLWACFWSYDSRNFSIAISILALATGIWFSEVMLWLMRNHRISQLIHGTIRKAGVFIYEIYKKPVIFNAILLVFFLTSTFSFQVIKFHDSRLHARQHDKLINITNQGSNPIINKAIIDNFSTYGVGNILSNYWFMKFIPGIGEKFKFFRFEKFLDGNFHYDPENIDTHIREMENTLNDPSIKYILLPDYILDTVNSILTMQGVSVQQLELNTPMNKNNDWNYLMLMLLR
ncbi:MAG: hypothetical protein LBC10_01580, partial [Deltaproteobacteria bacterium]|nr:hypothetical protein [Deltaproteobacteria bacterium]